MRNREKELLDKLINGIDEVIKNDYDKYNKQKKIQERLSQCSNICCFGVGKFFEDCVNIAGFENFNLLCDNDKSKWGKNFFGRKCISIDELITIDDLVVIITVAKYKDIYNQLKELNLEVYYIGDCFLNMYDEKYSKQYFESSRKNIIESFYLFEDYQSKEIYVEHFLNKVSNRNDVKPFYDLQTEGEYFNTELLDITNEEHFVDCGAFNGDTIISFLKKCNNEYKTIYAFELDSNIYKELIGNIKKFKINNVKAYNFGVGEEEKEIVYSYKGDKKLKSKLVRLDDILSEDKVTFIKMDIEGAEYGALKSSVKIIKEQAPKLAICTYHLLQDLWEIPLFIKKVNPHYKLYMRHHSPIVWDTVLYAQI